MIQLDHHGKPTYHPDATIDEAMGVQKGRCHFSAEGNKDFLICVTAYEPEPCGAVFEAATFREALPGFGSPLSAIPPSG